MRNDPVLKLNQKPHTPFGIVALGLSIAALILVIVSISFSVAVKEITRDLSIGIGLIEMISAMFTIGALGISMIAEGAKEMEKISAHIALLLSVLLMIYHVYVVWFGFF